MVGMGLEGCAAVCDLELRNSGAAVPLMYLEVFGFFGNGLVVGSYRFQRKLVLQNYVILGQRSWYSFGLAAPLMYLEVFLASLARVRLSEVIGFKGSRCFRIT